jgi:hypothetical protein
LFSHGGLHLGDVTAAEEQQHLEEAAQTLHRLC